MREMAQTENGDGENLVSFMNDRVFGKGECGGQEDFQAALGAYFIDVTCDRFSHAYNERNNTAGANEK